MASLFPRYHDEEPRRLDGYVPDSCLGHGNITLADKINLLNDSELRILEFRSPGWSIREPLKNSREQSTACCRTIEAVLEHLQAGVNGVLVVRLETQTGHGIDKASKHSHSVRGIQLDGGDDTKSSKPQPTGSDEQTTQRVSDIRADSTARSISGPRVFPLVPARYTLNSRSSSGLHSTHQLSEPLALVASEPLFKHMDNVSVTPIAVPQGTAKAVQRDALATDDLVTERGGTGVLEPTSTHLDVVQLIDATQPLQSATDHQPRIPEYKLGPPIELVKDLNIVRERSHSSAREWVSAASSDANGNESFARRRGNGPQDLDLMGSFDSATSKADMVELSRCSPSAHDDQIMDSPRTSIGAGEQETVTAPSTPALSSRCDSSPRNSILITPTMLCSYDLIKDGILAGSTLSYAEDEPPQAAKEMYCHDNMDDPLVVPELDETIRAKSPATVNHINTEDEEANSPVIRGANRMDEHGYEAALPTRDAENHPEPASESKDGDSNIDDLEVYSRFWCDQYDADSQLREASMVELPSTSILPPMVKYSMNLGEEGAKDIGISSVQEESTFVEAETENEEREAPSNLAWDDDAPDAVVIQVPSSPENRASDADLDSEHSTMDDIVDDSAVDNQGTLVDNESLHEDDDDSECAELLELRSVTSMLSVGHAYMDAEDAEIIDPDGDAFNGTSSAEREPETSIQDQVDETGATGAPAIASGTEDIEPSTMKLAPFLEDQPIHSNLEECTSVEHGIEAVEGFFALHRLSDAPHLRASVPSVVSEWLASSEPISSEPIRHPLADDKHEMGVLERTPSDLESLDSAVEQSEPVASPQPTFFTAQEMPNPFDQLPSNPTSASTSKQTEDLYTLSSNEDTAPAHPALHLAFDFPSLLSPSHPPSPVSSTYSFDSASYFPSRPTTPLPRDSVDTIDYLPITNPRDSVDTIAPLFDPSPDEEEKEYHPATAGWLGFRDATPGHRFGMPLQHIWGDSAAGSSDAGSSRPRTPMSGSTVRHFSPRRDARTKRPSFAGRPRGMSSGAMLEGWGDDGAEKRGLMPRVGTFFAGMSFGSKVLGGDVH